MSNFGEEDRNLQISKNAYANANYELEAEIRQKMADMSIPQCSWKVATEDSDSNSTYCSEIENRSDRTDDSRVSPSVLTQDSYPFSPAIPRQDAEDWNSIINSIINSPELFPEDCREVPSIDIFTDAQENEFFTNSREQETYLTQTTSDGFCIDHMIPLFDSVVGQAQNEIHPVPPDSTFQNPLTEFTTLDTGSELCHAQKIVQIIPTTSEQNNSRELPHNPSNETEEMNFGTDEINLIQQFTHTSPMCQRTVKIIPTNSEQNNSKELPHNPLNETEEMNFGTEEINVTQKFSPNSPMSSTSTRKKDIAKENSLKLLTNKKSEVKHKLKGPKKNRRKKSRVMKDKYLKDVITNSTIKETSRYGLRSRKSFSEELLGDGTLGETARCTRSSWSHPLSKKYQLRKRIEQVQTEVRRWLNGFDPLMDKSRAQSLIAEMQEIHSSLLMSEQTSAGLKHQDIQEFSQVTEKLMFQLQTGFDSLNIEDDSCSSYDSNTGIENPEDAESSDSPEVVYSNITNPISSATATSIPNTSIPEEIIMQNFSTIMPADTRLIFDLQKEKEQVPEITALNESQMPSASTAMSIPNPTASNVVQQMENSPDETSNIDFTLLCQARDKIRPVLQNSNSNTQSNTFQMTSMQFENCPQSNVLFTLKQRGENLISTSNKDVCVFQKRKNIPQESTKQKETESALNLNKMGMNQMNYTAGAVKNISSGRHELSNTMQSNTTTENVQFDNSFERKYLVMFNKKDTTKNSSNKQRSNVKILKGKEKNKRLFLAKEVSVNESSSMTQESTGAKNINATFNRTPSNSHQTNTNILQDKNVYPDVLKAADAIQNTNKAENTGKLFNSQKNKTIQQSLQPVSSLPGSRKVQYKTLPSSLHKHNAGKKLQNFEKETGARTANHKESTSNDYSATNSNNTGQNQHCNIHNELLNLASRDYLRANKINNSTAAETSVTSLDFLTQTQTSANAFTQMQEFAMHSNLTTKEHTDAADKNMAEKQVTPNDAAMQTDEAAALSAFLNMDSYTSHENIQQNATSSLSEPHEEMRGEQEEKSPFVFGITKVWLHSATEFIPNSHLPEGFWENKNAPIPQDILDALEDW